MNEKTSNEELKRLVKLYQSEKSQHTLDILCVKCEGMIKYVMKKFYTMSRTYNIDENDLKQELYLKFINSVNLFPETYDSFEAYIFNCLRNGALHFFRYNSDKIDVYDYTKGDMQFTSLYTETNEGGFLLDMFEDENALLAYDKVLDEIDKKTASQNIRNILSKFISIYDINLLFDMYGVNDVEYTMNELCIKYNISLHELICWERLTIMRLQTHKKLYQYYEQLMYNATTQYNYTYARWKYSGVSSTEYEAINNVYLKEKITQLLLPKNEENRTMKTLHDLIQKCNPDNRNIFGEKIATNFEPKIEPKN